MAELRPYADLPGAGAAGGLGAAIASLGGELVSGSELVLERIGFRALATGADLVVTGEGTVDRSSGEGKAVGEVVRICREEGVRCAVFGGRVDEALPGVEMHALSGDPARAADDLVELGERLADALSRTRVASSPSSGASSRPMPAFSSTSGLNSQDVMP